MTADLKARKLISMFYEETENGRTYHDGQSTAIACAIIHVEGVIEALPSQLTVRENDGGVDQQDNPDIEYWQSVLQILKSK